MPPEGFAPHFRSSPLTDPWEPILSRIDPGEAVRLGLELRPAHCNGRGFVHGGLIAALADNAMGLSCALVAGALEAPGAPAPTEDGAPRRGYLTVGLTVDYLATGRPGQWFEVRPRVIRVGRRMAFADALIEIDGKPAARASASFQSA